MQKVARYQVDGMIFVGQSGDWSDGYTRLYMTSTVFFANCMLLLFPLIWRPSYVPTVRNLNQDDSQAIIPTAICKSNIPLIRNLRTWNLPISRADLHDYHFNGRSEEIKRRRARSLSLLPPMLVRRSCLARFVLKRLRKRPCKGVGPV